MILWYDFCFHGGCQHHPIPIGQCLVQHSITKMIVGIHTFCGYRSGWRTGSVSCSALISPDKSRVGPEMPRAAICRLGTCMLRNRNNIHQSGLPLNGKKISYGSLNIPQNWAVSTQVDYCCHGRKSAYHMQNTSSYVPYPDTYANVVPQRCRANWQLGKWTLTIKHPHVNKSKQFATSTSTYYWVCILYYAKKTSISIKSGLQLNVSAKTLALPARYTICIPG